MRIREALERLQTILHSHGNLELVVLTDLGEKIQIETNQTVELVELDPSDERGPDQGAVLLVAAVMYDHENSPDRSIDDDPDIPAPPPRELTN